MRSVVVVGPPISQTKSVTDAFSRLGWAVSHFYFQLKRPSLLTRLAYRIYPNTKEWDYRKEFNDCLQNEVIPALREQPPSLLLIFRGSRVTSANRAALAAVSPSVAVWVIDSLSRSPAQDCLRPLARNVFYLDGEDATNSGGVWLPMGYERSLYEDLSSVKKTVDVLFLGYVRGQKYTTRRRYLLRLGGSEIARKWRCLFVGTTGTRRGDREMERITNMECLGRVSAPEFARRIASARICINVHQDDGGMPVNSAFFQIPAARTCQLAEGRDYLRRWLKPGEDYIAFSEHDFLEVLEDVLKDTARAQEVAATGRRTVEERHAFTHRVERIIEVMEMGS